ncbi:MAG: ATP-binding protein [Acidobacteriaceae bacterium]
MARYSAPIPPNEVARLAALYRYSILDTLPEQGYDDVTALASFICDTPFSTVTLVDRDRQWFKSEVGLGTKETGRADGFCARAVLEPKTMIVADTLQDESFVENPFVLSGPKIRFYAGAPLIAPDGNILGTVCVFDTRPRVLSPEQIRALEALSRQVMSLLEARLKLIENKRAAAALMQTEKLAAVGQLASSMAHGMNNPLAAITNLLYLSCHQVEDPQIREWLMQADRELRRVSAVANQMLLFHKQSTKPRAISCVDLFSSILTFYDARLKNARICVERRLRATAPIECIEADIRQALGNIISNAIDAMPTGGKLRIRSREGTDWRTGRKGTILTVADTGAGMDRETYRRMFEAFFSTKGIGGSGLGLWVCAEIMRRHHGRIMVRSCHGDRVNGTVFLLFLPLRGILDETPGFEEVGAWMESLAVRSPVVN